MKELQFTEDQIAFILQQADDGVAVEDTCRKAGISGDTYNRLRDKYTGLTPPEIRRLHELEDENTRLKGLVTELILEKEAPGVAPAEPLPRYGKRPEEAFAAISAAMVKENAGRGFGAYGRRCWLLLVSCWTAVSRLMRYPPADDVGPVKAADSWIRVQAAHLTWHGVRELSARTWNRASKTWHGREVIVLIIASGILGGFAFGLLNSSPDEVQPPMVPVEVSRHFNSESERHSNSYGSVSSAMETGWGTPEPWGTWMIGKTASILMGFDGPAEGDVELMIEARVQPAKGDEPSTLILRFNDAELGRWVLPAEARKLRRRFIVPQAVFNRGTTAHLTFENPRGASQIPIFGLQAMSLRDAKWLKNFRGFVDTCSGEKLEGWAVAEDSAVSVTATANGEPLKAVLSTVERPDLASHGLPVDAGFELTPAAPIAPGTKVEVRFADGRPLTGSPCQP